MDRVLRNTAFMRNILSLFIDESHCISLWGANFRKKYGTLGNIIAFLPRGTPVIAVTATLTARVRRDIHRILCFQKFQSRFVNIGNDRPNVALVVRACEHPMNTFADLDFILPANAATPNDIPKTYIYVDNVGTTNEIADYLADTLTSRAKPKPSAPHRAAVLEPTVQAPVEWSNHIRPFNATLSHSYREAAMACFRTGDVRILVCTEAAGMVSGFTSTTAPSLTSLAGV